MAAPGNSLVILIPVFNDWESLSLVLPEIDRAMAACGWSFSIVVVDDSSTEPMPGSWPELPAAKSFEVLHLRRNLGHQRAIAIGLYHAHKTYDPDAVVVLDGDGEDRPDHLPLLVEEFERAGRRKCVFAARTKRLEGIVFQFFYHLYRYLHRALTGLPVRIGNFSVLPREALVRLMVVSDLWNHYAASVLRARLPLETLPLPRGERLRGDPQMNFVSLLVHGLSAISVFSDQVSARLLALSVAFAMLSFSGIGVVWASGAGPGWTFPAGVLLVVGLQSVMFATLFVFTIISGRSNMSFLPLRDAQFFILGRTPVFAGDDSVLKLAEALRGREIATEVPL